jgi:CRP-like cAMP-binding protein
MHMAVLPQPVADPPCSAAGFDLGFLGHLGDVRALTDGEALHVEGQRATHGYRVLSGVVRLCKLTPDGRRCVLEFLLPGDVFGFEPGELHTTSAEAACPAVVARVPRGQAEAAALANPETGRALREAIAMRLTNAHLRMLRLACLSATERTASLLLEMADRLGEGGEVVLPMTRADLADHLGLRTETLCRVLAELRRRGAVGQPAPNRIAVRNRARLEEAAMQGRRVVPGGEAELRRAS